MTPRDSTEKEIATGKFCLFHGTHGHSTNECRHLRDIIEKLLREGKLDEYKATPRDRGQEGQAPNQDQPASKPTAQQKGKRIGINSIISGPHLVGRSFKAMDQYVNAAKHFEVGECSSIEDVTPIKQQKTMSDDVIFRNRDDSGVQSPTNDPLVITTKIGPALVHKVLVDNGSSVNILFKKAFE